MQRRKPFDFLPRRVRLHLKRARFNDTTRLRANYQIVGRAIGSLFEPEKFQDNTRGANRPLLAGDYLVKKKARRARVMDPKVEKREVERFRRPGMADPVLHGYQDPFTDETQIHTNDLPKKSKVFTKRNAGATEVQNKLVPTLVHEIVHGLETGKNHVVSANAFGEYFRALANKSSREVEYLSEADKKKGFTLQIIKQAAKIAFGQKSIQEQAKDKHPHDRVAEISYGARYEYTAIVDEKGKILGTMGSFGQTLGRAALSLERSRHEPGIGLIYLREVSKGKDVGEVYKEITSGKYDLEIKHWLERNPTMRRLFEQSRFYQR